MYLHLIVSQAVCTNLSYYCLSSSSQTAERASSSNNNEQNNKGIKVQTKSDRTKGLPIRIEVWVFIEINVVLLWEEDACTEIPWRVEK